MRFSLQVNGRAHEVTTEPGTPLLSVLRDELGLFGSRFGCGQAACGACHVLINGRSVPSCTLPVEEATRKTVITVEGLAGERLHPVQQAFIDEDAMQCGFCTSGMLISAAALLSHNPSPSDDDIRDALAPHLCRCGVYQRAIRAVQRAAR